jgi:DNA repair protein RadC
MFRLGAQALSNAEILALFIGTGSVGKTALEVAQRVLHLGEERYGSGLEFLERASVEEIQSVPGMGPAKAARLKAAVELSKRLRSADISDKPFIVRRGRDIYDLVKADIESLEQEHFLTVMLNSRNSVIGKEVVSIGSLDSSIVHPREVFKSPIKKSAASLVLVHNHPSGDPNPSDDDLAVTQRLIRSGMLLGIYVIDHVVVGRGKYVSIRETWPQYFA